MTSAPSFELSPTTRGAFSRLEGSGDVTSWDVTREILATHDEYGNHQGRRMRELPGPQGLAAHPVSWWQDALFNLFDPVKAPYLHGRLVILGLAEIDTALKQFLIQMDFNDRLRKELKEPFEESLRKVASPEVGQQAPVTQAAPITQAAPVAQAAPVYPPVPGPAAVGQGPAESEPSFDYYGALQTAALAATQAGKPVDSAILLGALLYQAAAAFGQLLYTDQSSAPPAALIAREVVQQRYPKDFIGDLNAFYRELAGDLTPSEAGAPPLTIPALLGLDKDYDIHEFSLMLTQTFSPDLTGTELEGIDRAARAFAAQVNPLGAPEPDHLLAVLLAPRLVTPTPAAQRRLLIQGSNLDGLRRVLLEAVQKTRTLDDLSVWQSALLAPDYIPPIAGYLSDYVRDSTVDRLDIESEVANIASVLTYKEVTPPLSLGLFGDWGSGKTFFITRLQAAIKRSTAYFLEQEQASQDNTPAAWCSRVVQINFNAWNYSDTNLWASLVTRIFEALYAEFNDKNAKDKEYKAEIEKKVGEAKGAVSQAQAEKVVAGERVAQAHAALISAQKERVEKENSLRGLINDLKKLLTNQEQKEKLNRAADALGYPEAAKSFEALEELNDNLQSFSSRTSALLVTSYRSHWTLLILTLCVVAVPVLTTLLVEKTLPAMGVIGQRVTEISVFLAGLMASLKFQLDRGMAWVRQVEEAYQSAVKIRQERLGEESKDKQVKDARDALVLAESQEKAAETNLQSAQAELQRLQSELAEFRPDRRFYRLIEERSQSEAYRQYLGIISLIRTDFEKISELMDEMAKAGDLRKMASEPPPIQRIILYIDDLDRCRPERVVEVLEAVHLLLAFPLFVVVVGVDPRWLHQSLLHHYQSTLSEADGADGRVLPGFATPQDYLEKIFQIPYALKPVEQSGYQNLVGELIKPVKKADLTPVRREGATAVPKRAGEEDPAADLTAAVDKPTGEKPAQVTAQADGGARPTGATAAKASPPTFSPLAQGQLDFTQAEQKDILLLWPLFRTPRTIKRYINLYRLLRASLRSQRDVTLFEGDAQRPGDYRVAMLILAVVTSFPSHAARFLAELDAWIGAEGSTQRPLCWTDFIHDQREEQARWLSQKGTSDAPAPPESEPARVDDTIREEVQGEMSWNRLLDALEQVCASKNFDPTGPETLRRWAVSVSRYSFTIG